MREKGPATFDLFLPFLACLYVYVVPQTHLHKFAVTIHVYPLRKSSIILSKQDKPSLTLTIFIS